MKRDMDLVRRILLELEQIPEDSGWIESFSVDGIDSRSLSGHIHMMAEADLIEAIDLSDMSASEWKPKRITWRGHEFLDSIRSNTLWEKTKKAVLEKTGGLALAALEAYARHLAARLLGGTSGEDA